MLPPGEYKICCSEFFCIPQVAARFLAGVGLREYFLVCHCSDSLAFATEPVLGSLANLLGAVERLPLSCQQELKVYTGR